MPTHRERARSSRAVARTLGLLLALLGPLALLAPPTAAATPSPWVWPLPGPHTVSRPFAPGATPFAAGHRGVDLPAPPGTPVGAAGAGRVSYAGLLAGRGVVVVVHGPLRTSYEPVSPVVRVGEAVGAGQQLGTLDPGHNGCPVAACLHWGLLRGAVYLDPVQLIEPGPVRLLPLDGPRGRAMVPAPVGNPPAARPLAREAPSAPAPSAPAPSAPAPSAPAPGAPAPPAPATTPGRRTAAATTAIALLVGTSRWWRRTRTGSA